MQITFKPHEEVITCSKVCIYFSSVSLWTSWHQKGINRRHLRSMFPLVLGDLLFFCLYEAISAFWIVLSISSTAPVCQYHLSLLCVEGTGESTAFLSEEDRMKWHAGPISLPLTFFSLRLLQ